MAKVHTSLIRTSGTALTRNRDSLTFPFKARPQAMSVYLRFIERGAIADAATGVNAILCYIGSASIAATSAAFVVLREGSGAFYRVGYGNGISTPVRATLAVVPSFGQTVELLATLTAAGVPAITQSINGATATSATGSSALVLPQAWAATTLGLSGTGATNQANVAFIRVAVARGVLTLNAMRRLAGVASK